MKDFFKMLFACLVALGVFMAAGFFVLMGFVVLAKGSGKATVPEKAVLVVDLDMNLLDHASAPGVSESVQTALQGERNRTLALATAVAAVDKAAEDKRIAGMYITGNLTPAGYGSGPAALREFRAALQRFKAKKPVLAYNVDWGRGDYYLGSVASPLMVNPAGGLDISGFASQTTFFGDALQKYGVQVQVTRVGKYKSAVEPFFLNRMSDASREQMQALMDDLWGEWKTAIAADRKVTAANLQFLADEKGALLPDEALAASVVDRVASLDEVLEELKTLGGEDTERKTFNQIDLVVYADAEVRPGTGKNRIAVVYAEGEIVNGEGRSDQVGGDRVSRELRKLRLDDDVKAVVLRVNSPGGSASASDLIQREVILTQKTKPVVVSMGTYAASGGYWISTYAERIFAAPNTITGSIGVFGVLPSFQQLANEHGVTFDGVQTSKMALLSTVTRPKNEQELARVQSLVDRVYDQFLNKVSEGRKLEREKVQEIAQGRVWSGVQAQKLGLVDELGTLADAAKYAAQKAGVGEDYRMDLPAARKSFAEQLSESLSDEDRPKSRSSVDALLVDMQRQVDTLRSLNDPRGTYARMPLELSIH